jgi:hypothetical protein
MGKNDELDRSRAAAFAWRFTRPGEVIVLPDELDAEAEEEAAGEDEEGEEDEIGVDDDDEEEPPEAPPAAGEGYFREAYEVCGVLAAEVDRIWLLPEAEQAGALEPILLRADELGLGLCAMQHYPWQSIRLLRLALRCRDSLPREVWEATCTSAAWLDYNHAELFELLVEVACSGDRSLVTAIMLAVSDARWKTLARTPGAIARIARVIDEGPTHLARRIAVDWISCAGGREAAPALRRALRLPHFVLRYRALGALDEHYPELILAEDVLFLLEDAVLHAPPDELQDEEIDRANLYLPRTLERAIVRLRPRGAIAPLVAIAQDRCAGRWSMRASLDAPWALCVLAAAFPEEALPFVDRRLANSSRERREMATEAAGRLPDDLARPRLLSAAADGNPEIAERAQALWLQRYAELCPREPMAGVVTALLDGPPTEQMRARLQMLRSAPLEARAAVVEVLLGEAPDPEALVLLLFAIVDGSLWERRPRPGLPESRDGYARKLVECFGGRAVEGLLALEARFPEGRFGWLHALSDLLTKGLIPEANHAGLRAAAARRLMETGERAEFDVISILSRIGPPPEVADRLWEIARDPAQSSFFREVTVAALAHLPAGDGRLDAAVQAEMEASLAVPDLPRFARAAVAGFGRKLPAAIALTERALDQIGPGRAEDPGVIIALTTCIEELASVDRVSDELLLEALARPGTYLCASAARYSRQNKRRPVVVEALGAVLTCDDPLCSAEAACSMLSHETIPADRPGLVTIATGAPLVLRAELVFMMRMRGAELADLWPLMEPLMVSPDPEVTEPIIHIIHEFSKAGLDDELRALLPRVVDPELHADILDLVLRDEDTYWEDIVEGDEDDEDVADVADD